MTPPPSQLTLSGPPATMSRRCPGSRGMRPSRALSLLLRPPRIGQRSRRDVGRPLHLLHHPEEPALFPLRSSRGTKRVLPRDGGILERPWPTWGLSPQEGRACLLPRCVVAEVAALPREWPSHLRLPRLRRHLLRHRARGASALPGVPGLPHRWRPDLPLWALLLLLLRVTSPGPLLPRPLLRLLLLILLKEYLVSIHRSCRNHRGDEEDTMRMLGNRGRGLPYLRWSFMTRRAHRVFWRRGSMFSGLLHRGTGQPRFSARSRSRRRVSWRGKGLGQFHSPTTPSARPTS